MRHQNKIPVKIIDSVHPFLEKFKRDESCIGICSVPRSCSSLLFHSIIKNYFYQTDNKVCWYFYQNLEKDLYKLISFLDVIDKNLYISHLHIEDLKLFSLYKKAIYIDTENNKADRMHQAASLLLSSMTGIFNERYQFNPYDEDQIFNQLKTMNIKSLFKSKYDYLNKSRYGFIDYFRKNKMKILKVTKTDILNDWNNVLFDCMKFLFNMNVVDNNKYLKKLDDKKYIDFILEHV